MRALACAAAAVCVSAAVLAGGAAASADAPPRRHGVEIRGFEFRPPVLEVSVGDTVVWINRDLAPHTATSLTRGGWDTGSLAEGEQRAQVVARKGEQSYDCVFHPGMRGRLIVR